MNQNCISTNPKFSNRYSAFWLSLWNNLQIIIDISLPAISLGGNIISIMLATCADIPRKNVIRFHLSWKKKIIRKIDTRILKICPRDIGFKVGPWPYNVASAFLGVRVCDDILRNAASLILLFNKVYLNTLITVTSMYM